MRKFMLAGLLLALTACGGSPTSTGSNTAATPNSATTIPAATSAATGQPLTGNVPNPGTVEAVAAQQVSKVLKVNNDQLTLVSKAEKDWPSSGLGCEEPGMMYAQVITSGYLMTYSDGTKQYEVHSDKTGNRAVVCVNGQPLTAK